MMIVIIIITYGTYLNNIIIGLTWDRGIGTWTPKNQARSHRHTIHTAVQLCNGLQVRGLGLGQGLGLGSRVLGPSMTRV